MPCAIDQNQKKIFSQLLDEFCKKYSKSPSCKEIQAVNCVGDGFYLLNGEVREFNIARAENFDGPIVQGRYRIFGRSFDVPLKTSRTQRYSLSEYLQPSIDENYATGGGSTVSEALFCLIPVIGWAMCASGCSGDAGGAPGPYMDVGNPLPADIWLDVPIDASERHSETDDKKELKMADGVAETDAVADEEIDVGEQTADIIDITVEDSANYELSSYEVLPNIEDTWQSSYESLGLCLNEATSCTKQAESGCWNINEVNASKPNTLAFLDPDIDSVDIEIEGGPYNVSANQTFERIEAGTVMDNGYFDSTIWLAPGLLLAADYIGDTVDIMLSQSDYNVGDLGACEYIYNYPCPGTDSCN